MGTALDRILVSPQPPRRAPRPRRLDTSLPTLSTLFHPHPVFLSLDGTTLRPRSNPTLSHPFPTTDRCRLASLARLSSRRGFSNGGGRGRERRVWIVGRAVRVGRRS